MKLQRLKQPSSAAAKPEELFNSQH
uniref:Uncharacterized protein n=1 Tax=Anguilla anguilla TaxID=7936 RepID=A0A0E9UAJ9_ANGAN